MLGNGNHLPETVLYECHQALKSSLKNCCIERSGSKQVSPDISVIIRTKNESERIAEVIRKLKKQRYNGKIEIIVVDSGSSDGTVEIAEKEGCRVIRIKPEDFSFGGALNTGIANANGEIIVNLSGHSVPVHNDFFQQIVAPFQNPLVAATFGRDIPWPEECPSQARDVLQHFPPSGLDGNRFSNANAAIRKKIWEKIRFDETLTGSEDLLWAKQVMNLGYRVEYVPTAEVFHSHGPSPVFVYKRAYRESRSLNAFLEKKEFFGKKKFLRFWLSNTFRDAKFVMNRGYGIKWLFHIPIYRFFQSVGLYRGFKEGLTIQNNLLSEVGRYNFRKAKKNGKKVLMVAHCFFPESVGGTEYYTLNLSKKLKERGWDVVVMAALRDITQKRYKVLESEYDGVRLIKIVNSPEFCTKFTEFFIDHNVDYLFKRVLEAEEPDIVHFQHTAYLSARLPEIARQMGVPSLFTLHDYWYMCYRSQLIRPSEGICPGPSDGLYCATCFDPSHPTQGGEPRFPLLNRMIQLPVIRALNLKERLPSSVFPFLKKVLYRRRYGYTSSSDTFMPSPDLWPIMEQRFRMDFMRRQLGFPETVISPSIHLKKRYEKEGFREILYIPHGFEPREKVRNIPFSDKLVIAYLSNIVPFKGADVVLRELEHVKERNRLKILLFGKVLDREYHETLLKLAESYDDVQIEFMGTYKGEDELREILKGVHFVVFPSLWEENHPLVIREALLYGIPVISTSLGGAPEAIEDGVNGFIFNPYKEGELGSVLNRILESPDLVEKVTEGARRSKVMTIEQHVDEIESVYDGIIGSFSCESLMPAGRGKRG
ncbi:MAG: glycosyltransferase [Nitrospirae bacterium]|nr:MAG: glycosyltransferase [Nitrospirota bacterium]